MPTSLLYVVTVAIWGTSWFAMRFQLGQVPELQSIAYRFLLASAILILWCFLTRRRLRFGWRDHLFCAIQGTTLFWFNYFLFYLAASRIPSGLMAVCFSTIVVMNIAGGAIFFGTRAERRVWIGALLGMVGLGLVFLPEIVGIEFSRAHLEGLILSLVATFSASLGNMVSVRHKRAAMPVVESNALGMGYGALLGLVAAALFSSPYRFDWQPSFLFSMAYLAFFASVIGFGSYLTLVQRIGADRAAYASVLFPLLALLLSTLFEGYRWTLLAGLGILLVLAGNLLVLLRPKPAPAPVAVAPPTET
ncbi:DMT family transporter [Hypericibacter sp.]|uniref:DMT family transporter n=1 Tax=Hypericibacter sp. TaxID=2705401 RepID=UPI003D6CBF9C